MLFLKYKNDNKIKSLIKKMIGLFSKIKKIK